ncbi:IS66 family insertion sequence element accessory protein TnpB [Cypionkella sp.]|uniref:IS66 family insertion sequence element accessory protein TnpB n=1 Tax=Cypionkella sp. TaxID=2811411 RepID=UPI00271C6A39|nr:IS66 family insertion sequence element accessory protein TnpB [Cypionkella sp.]MDO8985615.1 IS66 family insertion sequence element accessory protein TnpB [Cypionkella sp.]MDP2050130.1 IS66 family insertion sequence element accessory protein TnpB [Cypionkella sp.]
MIFPDQAPRIVIAPKPVDFRNDHDGLASVAQAELSFAQNAGVMLVFWSKRGDRSKSCSD